MTLADDDFGMPTAKTADTSIMAARQDPAAAEAYRATAEAALVKAADAEVAAGEEARKAAEYVVELERRVANGDFTISAKDLGNAREEARLAALRAQAFPEKTHQARRDADAARLIDTGHRLAALEARWAEALDAVAPVAVEHLTKLLIEYSAVTDEFRDLPRGMGGLSPDVAPSDAYPATVFHRPGDGFVPRLELPDVDELVGELLAAAFERAFGHLGVRAFGTKNLQGHVRQLRGTRHRTAPTDVLDLIEGWLGARQDPSQPGRHGKPKFITVERA